MSAPLAVRRWAGEQPFKVMETYVFHIAEFGIDEAGEWLTVQYEADLHHG